MEYDVLHDDANHEGEDEVCSFIGWKAQVEPQEESDRHRCAKDCRLHQENEQTAHRANSSSNIFRTHSLPLWVLSSGFFTCFFPRTNVSAESLLFRQIFFLDQSMRGKTHGTARRNCLP